MRKATIALFLALLCISTANGKPHGRFGNIVAMVATGSFIATVADTEVQAGSQTDESEDLKTLADYFHKGIAESRGHAALTAALKDYYSTMRALLSNLDPRIGEPELLYKARINALETNADNAKARLNSELEALGVTP